MTAEEPVENVEGGGEKKLRPLDELYFYLTEGCNLACRHCWLAPRFDPDGTKTKHLSVEMFELAIAQAKPLGLTGVKLTGGEPLLHRNILELLSIVRREKLSLTIETNGVLCTPQVAGEIAKSGKPVVSVSIDAVDAATHDRIRGVPGSLEAAKAGVRALVGAGISPQVIMSLMRSNVSQVADMIRMAEGLGASSVKFNVVQPTARGERMHETGDVIEIAELIALGHKVDMEMSRTTKLELSFSYPMAFRPLSRIARNGRGRCGILGILGVLASGHVALCGIGEQVPELVFGKLGQDKLEDIWANNPVLLSLRERLPSNLGGICGACLVRDSCLGSCVAQNYYRSRDLLAPFWFCELAAKDGLFPISRLREPIDQGTKPDPQDGED